MTHVINNPHPVGNHGVVVGEGISEGWLRIVQNNSLIYVPMEEAPAIVAAIQKVCGTHPAPPDSAEMRLRIMEKAIATLEEHQSDLLERVNIANRRLGAIEEQSINLVNNLITALEK